MPEFISKDILDEELTKVFAPLRVLQTIMGSCRVDIRNRFVTPRAAYQKIYTLFCLLLCINAFLFLYTLFLLRFIQNTNILILAFLIVILNFGACFFNVLHVTFSRNEENVQFYRDLQRHDRILKIHDRLFVDRAIYRENVCIAVIYSGIVIVLYIIALTQDITFWTYICLAYTQSVCTMEWLFFCNLIKYFNNRVRFINGIIFNHLKTNEEMWPVNKIIFSIKGIEEFEASDGHDFATAKIDLYVKNFFDDFKLFQLLYRFQMFLFCVKLVLNYCVVVEWALLGISSTVMKPIERLVVPLSGVSDACILILICVNFEILFGDIRKTKYLCTTIMSIYFKGPLRAKARKTIKMIENGPKHFSVYDLWRMDFSTVFNIINIVTNFIVTLLQFFFLKKCRTHQKMLRGAKVHALESNDFLECIRLIRICQNFFGACRVSVRGSDIRTRCWVQNIGLFCWACVATGFYYLVLTIDEPTDTSFSSIAVNVCLSALFFYCEVFIIIATSEDTVYLMKICQDIDSSFPKLKTNIYKDWFTYITTFTIIQYLVRGYNIATYMYSRMMESYTVKYGFNSFVSYLSELDILMWVKICDYLREHLRNMNVVLREKSKCTYSHDFNGQKYLFIFERCTFCFIYVLKLYRWTILFFYANFLIWTITAFRNQTAVGYNNEWGAIAYTFLKKMVFITAISCTTEMFMKVCEDIEQTCYDILEHHDKGELKELADAILYLLSERPPTTQIGGMLHLDFKLFFQFVSQLISYTVIILQFSNFKNN